ncbi:hypothetical protein ALP8811_01720 [Aliiroseovarius pelagivivens]|uniref:Uncharacterized protein n=1 Tax=Aliiroseovarius pelagivivens TaxID=1639690 RepID=A0A2R8AL26_9RHOB|nr:hypothetical protein [Aliiroseovarius pelagivivens]SPF76706.1 hypothetical protein ALP8811_01720 [Aliiroseovarius pelagivivens]
MASIAQYQVHFMLLLFGIGAVGTLFLFRKPPGHTAWKLADLVWVLLGGIGALIAIIAGLYTTDSSRLDRQIDVAYAVTRAFDGDAARFRLRYCEGATDPDLITLCEKIEFLSASTATNADLPLFIEITQSVAPLAGLSFLFGERLAERDAEMQEMRSQADAFDISRFLVFAATDDKTKLAATALTPTRPEVVGDFYVLARAYEDLVTEVGALKDEWEYLQQHSGILIWQVIALCMVSFAAPFRLGKSITELRHSM